MILLLWAVLGFFTGLGSLTFLPLFLLLPTSVVLFLLLRQVDRRAGRTGLGVALFMAALPVGGHMLTNLDFDMLTFMLFALLLGAGITLIASGRRENRQPSPSE